MEARESSRGPRPAVCGRGLHDQAREDRRDRHTRRPRAPQPARPGGARRLTLSVTSRQRPLKVPSSSRCKEGALHNERSRMKGERRPGTAAPKANPDSRRRLRVLNPVGAPRRSARPRPPRDGGALPEARRPCLGRSQRGAVRKRRLGNRARRGSRPAPAPMAGGGRAQRLPGSSASSGAPAHALRASRREVGPRKRACYLVAANRRRPPGDEPYCEQHPDKCG
jgi:hypothetical protein